MAILRRRLPSLGVTDRPCFFIVGPPRAGTTMVRLLLNSHPEVSVPPETWFFPVVLRRAERYGDFRTRQQIEAFSQDVAAATAESLRPVSEVFKVGAEEIAEAVAQMGARSYSDGFWAFMDLVARREGKRLWGEKTPFYTAWLVQLARCYPQARFLAMVRDPRDVVLSLHSTPWGQRFYPTLADGGLRWRYAMEGIELARRELGPDRLLEVRYEELVQDPEAWARRICGFLGLEFDSGLLRFHETAGRELPQGTEAWHSRVKEPINGSRVGLWRGRYSPEEVGLIEMACGPQLEAWGYRRHGLSVTAGNVGRLLRWRFQNLRGKIPWTAVAKPVT
jgi:Sulfotransferase family